MEAILLCRTGDDAGRAHVISGEECILGRGAECAISILHPQLSREHSLIRETEAGHAIEDLGSRNGTQVGDQALEPGARRELGHLDRITLGGELEFIYMVLDRIPSTEVVAAHVVDVGGARVPLQLGANTVGSAEEADLIVVDAEVAPVGALLELTASGLRCRRDPRAAFLRVNEDDLVEGRLADGDRVSLSPRTSFRIELVSGRGTPAPSVEDDQTSPRLPPAVRSLREADTLPAPVARGLKSKKGSASEPKPEPKPKPKPKPELEPEAEGKAEPAPEAPGLRPTDVESTATIQPADIQAAVEAARERHEREMAEKVASRQEAFDKSTSGRGRSGFAIEDEEGGESSTLRRTWSQRRPEALPTANQFQAVRREAAVRIVFRLQGQDEEQGVLLREGRHVVGRQDNCRVHLVDASVSREHAEIRVGPQGIIVKDLGSANGTWRGAERLTEEAKLQSGDKVRFGDVEAHFQEL